MLTQVFEMIEIRVVDNGPMCRPDFQYRYKLPEAEQWIDLKGYLVEWSCWETARWVKAEDIEND
jgi:hypothetical protein